nr:MAG TPA: hypothetical protein [Caudoviricetes sp.]
MRLVIVLIIAYISMYFRCIIRVNLYSKGETPC